MTAQQLKNSILQMAVQGKLVPQDPNDEPASVLLERIRAEKDKLIKEGKIKKEKNPSVIFRGEDNLPYEKIGKNEPVCIADEVPFEIPESWEWCRLGSIINLQSGQDLTPDKYNDNAKGIPYITGASNIEDGEVIINRWTEYGRAFAYKGELLLTCKGTVGTMAFLKEEKVHIARQIMSIHPLSCLAPYYLQIVLETLVEGLKSAAKSMIPGISREDVLTSFIPLPPLSEQERIIKKVFELSPCLDAYDNKEQSISALNSEFPELLKKSILQQAVMGKLVPQDENDEPAGILLERISAEKNALIKAGKLKKDKHESIIYRRDNSHYEKIDDEENCIDDEIPFEIPNNWEWVRLGTLVSYQNGYAYSKSDYSKHDVGIPVIKSNNLMTLQVVINHKTNYIEAPTEKMLESQIHENDLLMCLSSQSENTEPLGKTAIYRLGIPALLNQRVLKMTAYYYPIVDWMYYAINSEYFHYTVSHRSGGSAQSNLKLEHVLTMLIPIPPISEQERIINAIKASYHKISAL